MSSGVADSPSGHKEIGVAIYLPSGTSKKELTVHVGSTQTTLDIYLTLPRVLTDVTVLHKYWIEAEGGMNIESYHPRVVRFRKFFRSYRVRVSDNIVTTSRIRLGANVETNLVKQTLKWKREGLSLYRVLYVTLKCA